MNINRVYALAKDEHWLESVKKTVDNSFIVETIHFNGNLTEYQNCPQNIDDVNLILVDALWQPDVNAAVKHLRDLGWRYVVVVAANPTVKDARSILNPSLGFDYLRKTYSIFKIRAEIKRCFDEIKTQNRLECQK